MKAKFHGPFFLLIMSASLAAGQQVLAPPVIVFAEGAGGYTTLNDNLNTVYRDVSTPRVVLRPIPWSTADENVDDFLDPNRHRKGAERMKAEIYRIRQLAPNSPIYLVGYSAGASVVLLAAAELPPSTVERVILLGPSVSSRYDPRPALRGSRQGIDSFYTSNDDFMRNMEDMFGAPNEIRGATTATTTGFNIANPKLSLVRDPLLSKLRQYNAKNVERGHFDLVTPEFLRLNVVPMIQPKWVSLSPKTDAR